MYLTKMYSAEDIAGGGIQYFGIHLDFLFKYIPRKERKDRDAVENHWIYLKLNMIKCALTFSSAPNG